MSQRLLTSRTTSLPVGNGDDLRNFQLTRLKRVLRESGLTLAISPRRALCCLGTRNLNLDHDVFELEIGTSDVCDKNRYCFEMIDHEP